MRYLLTMGFLLLAWPAAAQINASAEPELVGVYKCEGVNAEGHPYAGVVEIVIRDQLVHARWTLESGEVQYGVGFVRAGRLSLGLYSNRDNVLVSEGLGVYEVTTSTPLTLKGEWAMAQAPGIYRETLVKAPAGHPPVSAPAKPKIRGDPKQEKQG